MNDKTIWKHRNIFVLTSLLLAMAACGGDDGDDPSPVEQDLLNVGDYVMNQCTVYYEMGHGWSDCRTAREWSTRPNQPVFTALNDCLIAKGHAQDNDPTVWDDSQEDRDRGWALLVICSVVIEG